MLRVGGLLGLAAVAVGAAAFAGGSLLALPRIGFLEPPPAPVFSPQLTVDLPAPFLWAQDDSRDLLCRAWRDLYHLYGAAPPYQWRISYEPQPCAGLCDLPAPPAV